MVNSLQGEVLAEISRAGLVESLHSGHLVMLNGDGSIFLAKGAIDLPIYPRSSVKAIQASGMARSGLRLNSEQWALVCASHSGSDRHLEVVRSILADAGLDESFLRNSKDKPLGEKERFAWGSNEPMRITQNCSGKHAGMLAACAVNGWDLESYLSPAHPLQVAIRTELETLSGQKVSHVTADGCGAPLFALSTLGLAHAFRNLTISPDPLHQEIVRSCIAHPDLVAGEGRLTTRLMRSVLGLFMKEGAEAVEVLTLADGRTLVFKISDGSGRAFGPIVQAALAQWGIDTPDESVKIYGGGEVVGSIEALL
ncbi:MAG: asparaginase [Actinomycetes bacterium]